MSHHTNKIFISQSGNEEIGERFDMIFRKKDRRNKQRCRRCNTQQHWDCKCEEKRSGKDRREK